MVKSHMLWRALDHVPLGQAVLIEWESLLGSDFDSTRSLLGSADKIAGYYPAPNPNEFPWRVVEHGHDDFVAVSDHSGDTIPLRKRDVIVFSLDFRRLSKELAAAFEFAPAFDPIDGVTRCWRIGTMAQANAPSLPVHLVIPAGSGDLRRAVESIRAAGMELGLILVPTRTFVTSAIEALVGGNRARVIVLEEMLGGRDSGRWEKRLDSGQVAPDTTAPIYNNSDIPLSDRAQEILQAMLKLKAFDSDRRKTNAEVTLHAFGSLAEPNDQKEVFSDLKDAGLLEVKRGRGGGYWLTPTGKSRAERLADG